jgi:hypothetical protein
MLSNIQDSPQTVRAHTNGGTQTSNQYGEIINLGRVWYNKDSIANILSLSKVHKVCKVTMDTSVEPAMILHKTNGDIMKFQEHRDGLYFFNTKRDCSNDNVNVSMHVLVNTVEANKQPFVAREIEMADKARDLYRKLGWPSQAKFKEILKNNLIINCPIMVDDAKRALLIFGPDVAVLKGKTTIGQPAPHKPSFVSVPIPAPILQHHQNVTLCVDFFCTGSIISTFYFNKNSTPNCASRPR